MAVVAGVSAERGLEAFYLQNRSIDSQAFIQYLLSILTHSKPSEFVIFLDNCRVHHSLKVKDFLKQHGIWAIYNIAYGPEYNPIERVWAQLKMGFKKQRLAQILNGQTPPYEKLIRNIMLSFPKEKIMSICSGTMSS